VNFTPRETTVLTAISYGLTNKQIGDHLHISEATVKNHVSSLLGKTWARDRAHLVRKGFELGILTNEPPPEEWITP
jgi:DNA-binding NarL/FixJ family response regulator